MDRGRFFPTSLFLPPYFYPAYDYEAYAPIVVQAPPQQVVAVPPAPAPAPAPTPMESLVLEYQNGQWVRVSNSLQPQARAQSTQPSSTKPPPAVLVFRDGHKEEVERYMIKGDVIFADANYWSTGSWTRKIAIVDLDVPATRKLNEERGGNFSLPSGPNEVMLR
jgi:hypothetical protein